MNGKKVFFSILIFSILIGGFLFSYFYEGKKVDAAGLSLCIKWKDAGKTIVESYQTIDDVYVCPRGYELAPSDFNLNLLPNTGEITSDYINTNPLYPENNPENTNSPIAAPTGNNGNLNNLSNTSNISLYTTDFALDKGRFENLDGIDYPFCVSLNRSFGFGALDSNTGGEVTALQGYLNDRGYLDVYPTGYFGSMTHLALRKFQYRNQITVSGYTDIETRDILRELTCQKIVKVLYLDKPYSPSPKYVTNNVKPVNANTTLVKKNTTIIPATNSKIKTPAPIRPTPTPNPIPTPAPANPSSSGTLTSINGNMYLSQKNNLYFTYNSRSSRPYICISLNGIDCSNSSNFGPVVEGIQKGYYEVINIGSGWAFSLYNGSTWGQVGDKVKIFLKDSQNGNSVSIYTVNVLN